MAKVPESIAQFLSEKRIAVAGVSRRKDQAAHAVFRKLRACGYEVFPVNPKATEVEGVTCYPNLAAIPKSVDSVVVATHRDGSQLSCPSPQRGEGVKDEANHR